MNTKLRKELTRYDFMMLSAGGILGSGWLFGVLYSTKYAGPAAIIAWLLGGILMVILALPIAELASTFPESGAMVRYPSLSHGSFLSALQGWSMLCGYAMSPTIEAEASVQYIGGYIHGLYSKGLLTFDGMFLAVIMVLIYFVLNYFGVQLFKRSNNIITTFKYIVPLITIVSFLYFGLKSNGVKNITTVRHGGFMPFGVHGIFVAIAIGGIFFSYTGFRQSIDLAAEGRNPQRDVPFVMLATLIISTLFYVLLEFCFLISLSHSDLVNGWDKLDFSAPFAQLALAFNFGWLATVIYADSLLSPFGNGLVYFASAARLVYAMPKCGYGPKIFRSVNDQGVPYAALIVILFISLVTLFQFRSWDLIVGILSSVGVMSYSLSAVSATVLRSTAINLNRPFYLGKHLNWIGPIAFSVGSLIFYSVGWPLVGEIDGIIFFGGLIYFFYYFINKLPLKDVKSGAWWIIYLLIIAILSYLGSFGEGIKLITFPESMFLIMIISVIFYFIGVRFGYRTKDVVDYENGINRDWNN